MSNGENREQWGSRLGFIVAAAGSAVGLGNVWRFPYLVGMNGGAAFVIVYIVLAVTVGISVMLAEWCLGRGTRRNGASAFKKLKANPFWQAAGWLGVLAGGFVILSYYGVIAGWTIRYAIHSLTDLMPIAAAGGSGAALGEFLNDTPMVVGYQIAAMLVTILIVAGGISGGIERACKILMPLLLVLLIVLIVRALTLEGASAGLEFYLKPDFSKLTPSSLLDALGQAFFSLSLGMGIMVTYASYIPDDETLGSSSVFVLIIDTVIAFSAGLAIFPAVFAMGIEPGAGVGLTFVTLPGVFANMPGGAAFSCMFFLLLFFAAVTSMMSLLEVAVSFIMDEFNTSRKVATWVGGGIITLLGIPSAMSLAEGSSIPMIHKWSFFDFMDTIANNLMMPLSALGISLYIGWKWTEEAKRQMTNNGLVPFPMMAPWLFGVRLFAPVMILVILINGWPF